MLSEANQAKATHIGKGMLEVEIFLWRAIASSYASSMSSKNLSLTRDMSYSGRIFMFPTKEVARLTPALA